MGGIVKNHNIEHGCIRRTPTPLKERVHSEIKISSIMMFTSLIMPTVFIFFRPLSLTGQKGYSKMMQDAVMQVPRWLDTGPLMF